MAKSNGIRRPTEEQALAEIRRWERKQQTYAKQEEMRMWRVLRYSDNDDLIKQAREFLRLED